MVPSDRISIIITFLIGLLVGAYLYTTGFATTFKLPEANDAGIYTGFVINGESYGGCREEQNCLSFQILGNGTYRAIFDTDSSGRKKSVKEGRVSRQVRLNLERNLKVAELTRISQPKETPECLYEDTNYRFKVSFEEVEYEIDTCVSEIDRSSSAWTSLTAVYNYIGSRY